MSCRQRKFFLNHLKKRRTGFLTQEEVAILKTQIRRDSLVIGHLVRAIDLLVNQERCPEDANLLLSLRRRLAIAIEENDTFRRVLWRHIQMTEPARAAISLLDPVSFLIHQIKSRERRMLAQAAMK